MQDTIHRPRAVPKITWQQQTSRRDKYTACVIEENLLDAKARGVSDENVTRKRARYHHHLGGLGLSSPESSGKDAYVGGKLAGEDAVQSHFTGRGPQETPSQVPSHLAKTRLLTQHRATAEDFVKVGSKRHGDAHDPSVMLADQAEGRDRWLPQHYYEILVEKTPGVSWRRKSPIISGYFPVRATTVIGPSVLTKHQAFEATLDALDGIGFDSRGGMAKTARDFPDGVTPPTGPPEDDPPSPPPATSSSASSFGNSGRMAPPATSQRSFALNEEGVYAEEINRIQGGGQSYPSSQCLVH
jgi:hypothetical protein